MLLGLCDVARHQVGLAHVLVRAAVLRVDGQRLVVVEEGGVEVAGLAIGVAEPVVGVGVAIVFRTARDVGLEQRDGLRKVLGLDRGDGLAVFRIDRRQLAVAERGHASAATATTAAATAGGEDGRRGAGGQQEGEGQAGERVRLHEDSSGRSGSVRG